VNRHHVIRVIRSLTRFVDRLATLASASSEGVKAQGTTVTGHLPAFTSRTASEPTSR
jgi:hypothetical protein